MRTSENKLLKIVNVLAIVLLLVLISGWVESAFWEKGPKLLGVSQQILGAFVLSAWLVWQGFRYFGQQKDEQLPRVFKDNDRGDDQ